MRAIQIIQETGPDTALKLVETAPPEPTHLLSPGTGVVIDVKAAGVSFPELLQTRGMYQFKTPLPFIPGSEVGGVVRSAPDDADVQPGDRVAAFCVTGGFAEVSVAPAYLTYKLPDVLNFRQGAGLILNYHTAYFLLRIRGRLVRNETVLVHGAAGGLGTATIQVAKGLGAKTIAVVSTDKKASIAERAGADHVLRSDGPWSANAKAIGVDIVIDAVGGDRFTDSLRTLREDGRLVVAGFAAGSIPEVKVNRVLLTNTEIVGAAWGSYMLERRAETRRVAEALNTMIADGFVRPMIGAAFPLERAAEALRALDDRQAVGKVVLDVA